MKIVCFFISFIVFYSCKIADHSSLNNDVETIKNKTNKLVAISQVSDDDPILIYNSHSRGYYYVLKVYGKTATLVNTPNGNPVVFEVAENDIKELKSIISKISIDDFLAFKAPTEKRFYDGAPHTVLSIYKNKEKYSSHTFDGGFPPKGLEVLVNKVLSLYPEK